MFQVRQLKLRTALFLINLLLVGYLGFLLLNLYRSHEKIQNAALVQLQHTAEKRALALETFLSDRSEDLVELAEKQRLSAYFDNLSLGMSPEYGLGASLEDLRYEIERYRLRKQLDGSPLYRRMVFVDKSGAVLASAAAPELKPLSRNELKPLRHNRAAHVQLYILRTQEGAELVMAYPYLFKEQYAGHLLAWIKIADLYRHFIESANDRHDGANALNLLLDHNAYLAQPSGSSSIISTDSLPLPAVLKPGRQKLQLKAPDMAGPVPVTAFTVPVNGTPLFLSTLAVLDRDEKASPMQLVLTTGAIGLLILAGTVMLVRTDLNTRVIETRLEETRIREQAMEQQNRILAATAEELKEKKEWLTLALEGAALGLWDWHILTGQVLYNEQWAAMLGYRLEELDTTISTWQALVHPDDLPGVEQVLKAHLAGMTPYYETEHRCLTKSGAWLWILDRGRVAERDAEGRAVRMAGTHLDISARKQAEAQLRLLNEELEQRVQDEVQKNREKDVLLLQQDKMASIGQLAAGVAHEINNPMGFIISNLGSLENYSEALIRYLESVEQQLQTETVQSANLKQLRDSLDIPFILGDLLPLLTESLEGADRVKQIVLDLKDFARMDDTTVQEADLNQCVRSTINIVRNELKYVADLDLQLADLPPVNSSPQQINQVITNLLVNAAHAIEGHGTIRVVTRQEGDKAVLVIADTGKGIPPEVMKKIFDPFFTTKPVGQGTGLGLTITYDLIRKNGGSISVESEPGTGTIFTVLLPLSRHGEEHHV
jgi:PAS domain S-box-containing protein